ncbi:MAG: nucleotidyltransferase family protein, partial [Myxococcota bacterium]
MVTRAMILAAGLGTRLAPLTLERPKPLVEVLGTPLVHFALEHARRAGAKRVALNTHHLYPALEEALGTRYRDVELVYSHEPVLRGTGGGALGMRDALGGLDGPTLLLNADALIDLDIEAMVAHHRSSGPLATLALQDT